MASGSATETSLLVEYEACLKIVQHLDTMNSNIAALFLGGSLAATAFVFQKDVRFSILLIVSLFSTVFFLGWVVLVHRSDAFTKICFERMKEIETILHLSLQLYFEKFHADSSVYGILLRRTKIGERYITTLRWGWLPIFGVLLIVYLTGLWLFTLNYRWHFLTAIFNH